MKRVLGVVSAALLLSVNASANVCKSMDLNGEIRFRSGNINGSSELDDEDPSAESPIIYVSVNDRDGNYNVYSVEGGQPGSPNEVVKYYAFLRLRSIGGECLAKIERSPFAGRYRFTQSSLAPGSRTFMLEAASGVRVLITKIKD